jgi:GNAT superfamily N-acetyltransferase
MDRAPETAPTAVSSAGIAFRRARPEDAAGLVSLVGQLGYPSSAVEVARRLARVLARDDHVVFLAADGERTLGWVHVLEFSTLASEPCALITGLVVESAMRRRGVGRALVERAEQWARSRGLSNMRLRSRVTRAEAHAFYRRLGYRSVKQQLQFRKEL